ncbi:MAG: glycosyltransferase family A protein [Bacteroidetes bacterium]|nr:glycosyltransferase family A protein [Bacteroidota bacterium]
MPKVSVIIPCYNQGLFIEDAINSVLSQTFTDFEIIVVNDGSNDQYTQQFLSNYTPEKTKIYHTINKGVSAARNFAINKSNGKYILPLDADDKIATNYLMEAVNVLDQNHELKLVYSNGVYFGALTGSIKHPDYDEQTMLKQNLIFNSSFYRKIDWEICGGYDESFLTGWEDWEFWLRLINHSNQVHKLDSAHLFYRMIGESRNACLKNEQLVIVEQQLYLKHISKYLKYFSLPLTHLRENEYLKNEQANYIKYKTAIYNSLSYRLGSFLLSPLKLIKRNEK